MDSRSQLSRVEISRRAGKKGWASTGKAIECDEEDADATPEDGAARLIELAEAWVEENGGARLCFVLLGRSQRGNDVEIERVLWNLSKGDDVDDEDPNVLDVLRETRRGLNDAITANGKLLENMGMLASNVVGMLDVARQQGMVVVEAKKVEIEAEKWRLEREFEAQDADRDADLTKERMRHGVGVLGMVADGFMAHKNAEAHKAAAEAGTSATDVKRGDAARLGLVQVFSSLDDEERQQAKDAVGDDLWDMFAAAVANENADERKAILKQIALRFSQLPDKQARGEALKAAIGEARTMSLMGLLQAAVMG